MSNQMWALDVGPRPQKAILYLIMLDSGGFL